MTRSLRKILWREMARTPGRFFALLFITVLSVSFFSGLRLVAPIIEGAANGYLAETGLEDYRLYCSLGIT